MVKAIIYDKDGTLMQFDAFWIPVAQAAIRSILEKYTDARGEKAIKVAGEIETEIGILNGVIDPKGVLCGGTYSQFAEIVDLVFKKSDVNAVIDRVAVERAVEENIEKGVILPTCDDLRFKLEKARKTARIFVVTTDCGAVAEYCLKKLGIFVFFFAVFCDDGETPCKPDPFAANEIARELSVEKNELFVVGDTETDKCFADNAGVDFVFVGKEGAIKEKLKYKANNAGAATDLILSFT